MSIEQLYKDPKEFYYHIEKSKKNIMNSLLSKKILIEKLLYLGLVKGDTVFISSNIVALGKISENKNKYDYCELYFEALMSCFR